MPLNWSSCRLLANSLDVKTYKNILFHARSTSIDPASSWFKMFIYCFAHSCSCTAIDIQQRITGPIPPDAAASRSATVPEGLRVELPWYESKQGVWVAFGHDTLSFSHVKKCQIHLLPFNVNNSVSFKWKGIADLKVLPQSDIQDGPSASNTITHRPRGLHSVNTREFCTTSNNRKDFMFNSVAMDLAMQSLVIRVSFRVSRRYQNHHRRRQYRHRHLCLPGRSLRVRANLRVLPYN